MGGFAVNGLIMVILHLGPNLVGLGFSEYQQYNPNAFAYEKQIMTRYLQQGRSSHKAAKRGQHTLPGPKHAALAQ